MPDFPLSPDSQRVDLSRLIVDALLVSHPHQDHFGLMARLPPGTPVYIGRLARSLIDAPQVFIGGDRYALDFHDFKAWQPFTIGEFTITPYLVDHSATDAYAFLIEVEGKRLFYSGDFRSHGRKGSRAVFRFRYPLTTPGQASAIGRGRLGRLKGHGQATPKVAVASTSMAS